MFLRVLLFFFFSCPFIIVVSPFLLLSFPPLSPFSSCAMATPMSSNSAIPSSPSNRRGESIVDSLALPLNTSRLGGAPPSDALSDSQGLDSQLFSRSNDGGDNSQRTDQQGKQKNALQSADGEEEKNEQSKTPRPRRAGEIARIEPMIDQVGETVRIKFQEFLMNYHEEPLSGSPDPDGDGMHAEPYYLGQIRRMNLGEHRSTTVFVDFSHILRWDEHLARTISDYYQR